MKKPRHVFLIAALCALPAVGLAADHYSHVTSNDGKGHWLYIQPENVELTGPAGTWPVADDGALLLLLELYCREGEEPPRATLSFSKHPEDPPAALLLSDPIRFMWRGLTGDKPAFQEEVRIRLGESSFTATVLRGSTSYSTETEYFATLPAGETARGIVAAEGGSLMLEMEGARIRGRARYAIAADFAQKVDRHCDI